MGSLLGRPGINPLRSTTTIYLKKSDFEGFVEIARKLKLSKPKDGRLDFLGNKIEIGEKTDIFTAPYKPDFDDNLMRISEAKRNADFVFVSVHNHEKRRPGETYFDDTIEYIAEFVETFSKAAVDAGADAVLGHGTHCLNGIEIYKDCPIFYGLGNFISQSFQDIPKPYDWYEARGLHERTYEDESLVSSYLGLSGKAEERRIRRLTTSVVAEVLFDKGKAVQIILYPIKLLGNQHQGGRPLLASGSDAEEILSRLSRLSADYGTKITIEQGVGRIVLANK